jgi:hypothetical protein
MAVLGLGYSVRCSLIAGDPGEGAAEWGQGHGSVICHNSLPRGGEMAPSSMGLSPGPIFGVSSQTLLGIRSVAVLPPKDSLDWTNYYSMNPTTNGPDPLLWPRVGRP